MAGTPSGGGALGGRSALINATLRLGLTHGLSAITSRAVAESAGVAHSLVRYHFGSIDALVTAALVVSIDEGIAARRRYAEATSLATLAQQIMDSVVQYRDVHAFLYEALLESRRRHELYPQVERYFVEYREAMTSQLLRFGVPEGLADVAYFAIEGMTFKEVAFPDELGTIGAIEALRTLLGDDSGIGLIDPPRAKSVTEQASAAERASGRA